jgi:hypothetical protein
MGVFAAVEAALAAFRQQGQRRLHRRAKKVLVVRCMSETRTSGQDGGATLTEYPIE